MTVVAAVLVVWFALLALYVVLQARRPRLSYPRPPHRVADRIELSDAA